jgi:hypothetical protein
VRVHLAGEHALELDLLDVRGESVEVGGNRLGGAVVLLGFSQVEQFAGPGQAVAERANTVDDPIERSALLAELLRPLRVVPNVWVLELPGYFLETLALGVVVKDTP